MSKILKNIENFNLVVLHLFSRLYESFPRPLDINGDQAIDIGFDAVPDNSTDKEAWVIGTMDYDVIVWLAEEGFLRYQPDPEGREGYFWKVRLTLKGLTILGCVPTSLNQNDSKEPLIQKARQAISSTASAVSRESIKLVVAEIFKLALAPDSVISSLISV